MKQNVTILAEGLSAPVGDRRKRRSFDLPPALLRPARARLTLLALLFFIFCIIGIGVEAAFGVEETRQLTGWIADILDDLENEETIERVRNQVLELCARFPVYG